MIKTNRVILIFILVLVIPFLSCSKEDTSTKTPILKPPVAYVKARTYDGSGIVVLVMRTWDNALSEEERQEIRDNAKKELPEILSVIIDSTTIPPDPGSPEMRVLTFCYAIYTDKIPDEFSISTPEENRGYDDIYKSAENWFVEELAGISHSYK